MGDIPEQDRAHKCPWWLGVQPPEGLPSGTRVWKVGSGEGASAQFGVVVVVPDCYVCTLKVPPIHAHCFSVKLDSDVWEILGLGDVREVTPERERRIRCGPGPACSTVRIGPGDRRELRVAR